MPGKRSPNCPAHDLEESILKVGVIYQMEGRNSFSGADAVVHMGYNGLNGASRRALGAVRAFGLVEGRGEQLRVSDDAVLIIADADADDQRERQEALIRALCHNRVFSDLYDQFGDHGSVSQLSGFLQKKYRFKPLTADNTAQVYQRSLSMLHSANATTGPIDSQPLDIGNPLVKNPLANSAAAGERIKEDLSRPQGPIEPSAESRTDSFTLENGIVHLSWPLAMNAEEFEDFTDWLILEHRKISRQVRGDNGPVIDRCKNSSSC